MEALKILISYLTSFIRDHAQRARQSATVGAISTETIIVTVALVTLALAVVGAIGAYVYSKIDELPS